MFNFFGYYIKKFDLFRGAIDLFIILLGFYLYYYFGLASSGGTTPGEVSPFILIIISNLITWGILFALGAYDLNNITTIFILIVRLSAAFVIAVPLAIFVWWLAGFTYIKAIFIPITAISIQLFIFFCVHLCYMFFVPKRILSRKIMVITSDKELLEIKDILKETNAHYKVESHLAPESLKNYPRNWLVNFCLSRDISLILMGHSKNRDHLTFLAPCRFHNIRILDIDLLTEQYMGRVNVNKIYSYHLLFDKFFAFSIVGLFTKRLFDIVISCVILLITLPITLCVMLSIFLYDGKPIFYSQKRIGRGGRCFSCYKFRSMVIDAEKNGAVWAQKKDPRITPIGRFIRKTRIDEIPQCFNVLRGDMSIVGPRPERPKFVDILSKEIPTYQERHFVKPGITGWAQINDQYGASIEDAGRKLSYDLYYIKHYNIILDILILLKTIAVVIWPNGVR